MNKEILEQKREVDLEIVEEKPIISPEGCDKLENLRLFAKKNVAHVFDDTIHIISNINTLLLAYELIKSNPGNMTPGVSKETLDGISSDWIIKTSEKLLAGKYNFTPSRRKFIPKPNDPKAMRPLGIASPREKVVQKAIQLVLEAIFEPTFSDESHGFRPNRGNHTALQQVKKNFKAVNWVIEVDISKCFDTIDHGKLLEIIRGRISCDKTVKLIKSALEAGFMDGDRFQETSLGTPQGSVLSPLLCNIFMDKLDKFLTLKKEEFDKGEKKRPRNNLKRKLKYQLDKTQDRKERKKFIEQIMNLDSNVNTEEFKKLTFVRYADDFIVGIAGKHADASNLKNEISKFLTEYSLNLNLQKTKITKFSSNKVFFLGTHIRGTYRKEKPIKTIIRNGKAHKTKITPQVSFHAPIKRLLEKLAERGFMKKKGGEKIVPTNHGPIINFDHSDIVARYNQIIRGILNYYSFVDNKKSLGVIIHSLKHSCALTLALKFKERTAAKMFKKFGKNLKCKDTKIELSIPKTFARTQKFMIGPPTPDSIIAIKWNNKLTRSNFGKECILCKTKNSIEMHHVKRIKDLKNDHKKGKIDFFTMQMRAINRKQVPLCHEHHVKLHKDELTQEDREKMLEYVESRKKNKNPNGRAV
jgi:group II intron reverse transcriptase/maturase